MAAQLSPLAPIPASQAGAIAGYESRCTCGIVIRSSLRPLAEADASAHLAWHQKQGR